MAAPYGKRSVILQGHPIINEDGTASAAITPGYLVQGVTSIAPHSTGGGNAARAIALERDELGTGIDSTYAGTNTGTGSPNYAIGDVVKIGVFAPGQRFVGYIASGQNVTAGDFLESAGDGTFREHASGTILARALDTVLAANTGLTKIRLEAY